MSKQKKYEMIREQAGGLFNIRALRDIPEHDVRKGDWGGLSEPSPPYTFQVLKTELPCS